MIEVELILENEVGLHARPAAEMTKLAAKYKSKVIIYGRGRSANAKSLLSVLTMVLHKGDNLLISVDGPDEAECLNALQELIINNFHEQGD